MRNRKREIRTSGSVRDEDGQHPHLLGRGNGQSHSRIGVEAIMDRRLRLRIYSIVSVSWK
jgi:hypothetical protein